MDIPCASDIHSQGIVDPTTLESLACREALSLASDLALCRVIVATDCKTLVDRIQQGRGGPYGVIIQEIKLIMREFMECSVIFEGRASNYEAHCLARHTLNLHLGRHMWLLNPHDLLPISVNIGDQ